MRTLSEYSNPKSLSVRDTVLTLLRLGLGVDASAPISNDWAEVFDVSSIQGVSTIVFDGVLKMFGAGDSVPGMSENERIYWLANTYRQETLEMAQRKAASDLAELFAKNNITTFALKGFVVSECYPVPSHRQAVDFDCFLRPYPGQDFDAYEKGNVLMEQNGFEVSRDFYKHSHATVGILQVENHCFLTPFRGNKTLKRFEIYLQSLLKADNGADKIDGTELSRPPVLFSALFLLEHSYSHFLLDGIALRHITDWAMFCRRHKDEIDWETLERQVDEYGFRRFYDALCHVGEYVLGEREYVSLSDPEKRMMEGVWEGQFADETENLFKSRINKARNIFQMGWRYRLFSSISMPRALWIKIKGVLFIGNPKLN